MFPLDIFLFWNPVFIVISLTLCMLGNFTFFLFFSFFFFWGGGGGGGGGAQWLCDRVLDSRWRVAGLSLTGGTVLCPLARHYILCLVLVQPRKTRLDITEKLLTGM